MFRKRWKILLFGVSALTAIVFFFAGDAGKRAFWDLISTATSSKGVAFLTEPPLLAGEIYYSTEIRGRKVEFGAIDESKFGLAACVSKDGHDWPFLVTDIKLIRCDTLYAKIGSGADAHYLVFAPAEVFFTGESKEVSISVHGFHHIEIDGVLTSLDPEHHYRSRVHIHGKQRRIERLQLNLHRLAIGAPYDADRVVMNSLSMRVNTCEAEACASSNQYGIEADIAGSVTPDAYRIPSAETMGVAAYLDYGDHLVSYLRSVGFNVNPTVAASLSGTLRLDALFSSNRLHSVLNSALPITEIASQSEPLVVRSLLHRGANGDIKTAVGAYLYANQNGNLSGRARVFVPNAIERATQVVDPVSLGPTTEKLAKEFLQVMRVLSGGSANIDVHLRIRDGQVMYGPFPLFKIAPIAAARSNP